MTNLVETIAGKTQALPLEMQREVLSFVEFKLQQSNHAEGQAEGQTSGQANGAAEYQRPLRPSNFGSLAHLGITVTDEDIAEVRREMWANFPREEPS